MLFTLETYWEIFAFLPLHNVLLLNSACAMFFHISQHFYRPLQRTFSKRVIESLHIAITCETLQFVSANFVLRLMDENMKKSYPNQCTYSRKSYIKSRNDQWKIDRLNANKCWPMETLPSMSIPTTTLPSDILAIENICLKLTPEPATWDKNCYCCTCERSCVDCVSFCSRFLF